MHMKKKTLHRIVGLSLAMLLSLSMSSCFKEPSPIGPGVVVDPKPDTVSDAAISVKMMDNDDSPSTGQHYFDVTSKVPFLNLSDKSIVIIDTTGSVPVIKYMKLYLSPKFDSESEAREAKMRQTILTLENDSVIGDEWHWIHRGEVSFNVRVAEKPTPRYNVVTLLQSKMAPYSKDDAYARLNMWKVTAKHTIVMQLEAQMVYQVSSQGGPPRERARVIGEIRINY